MGDEAVQDAARRWLALDAVTRAEVGPEVIDTCGDALRELVARLRGLGYPVDPMLVTSDDVDAAVEELEGASGVAVPLPLVEVWRRIGDISLVDLGRYRHMAFWEERVGADARTFACDGLVVEGPCEDESWIGYAIDELEGLAEAGEPPAFPLAPDHLHKDNTSGGDPYGLVPGGDDPWMPVLCGFDWCGPAVPSSALAGATPDFVSYLRTAVLECGGFPGLFGSAGFEPIRRELTEGLPVF